MSDDEVDGNRLDDELDDDDFDDDDEDEVDGNRVADEGTARAVLEYVVGEIVDDADAIEIDAQETGRGVVLSVRVAPDDMGKVIGRRGRVAQAIRTVVRVAGAQDGVDTTVDIVD